MNILSLNKDNLHHAYIIEGTVDSSYSHVCDFCESHLDFQVQANPDFVYEKRDKFLISDAKWLKDAQLNMTTSSAGRKIFIVSFNFITLEAQNALLKVLEEPTKGTHIFILTPASNIFLDTILSRVIYIKNQNNELLEKNDTKVDEEKFLKSDLKNRLDLVASITKDIKDEKESKMMAINFVKSVKEFLHKSALDKKEYVALEKVKRIEEIESYLGDNSASVKILLERLALVI